MGDGEGPVKVAEAPNEMEAAVLCGYLESRGIHAIYDNGGSLGAVLPAGHSGPQQILVAQKDAEDAQAILATAESAPSDDAQG